MCRSFFFGTVLDMNRNKEVLIWALIGVIVGGFLHMTVKNQMELNELRTSISERLSYREEVCTHSYIMAMKQAELNDYMGRETTDIMERADKFCFYVKKGK